MTYRVKVKFEKRPLNISFLGALLHPRVYYDFVNLILSVNAYSNEELKMMVAQWLQQINSRLFSFFQMRLRHHHNPARRFHRYDTFPSENYFRTHYPFIFS